MTSDNADRRLRASLSPEERVLLASVRDDSDQAQLAALLAECDLTQLLYVAVSERATSVLWPRIAPLLGGRNPTEVQALQRTARVSDFRLLLLEDRLASSVAALSGLATPVVLLKGAALAVATYRRFDQRPMGDLDVLISSREAAEAQQRLVGGGWQADPSADAEQYAHHHHLPMITDGSGAKVSIELHTELFVEGNPFRFGAAEVRAAAVPASIRGHDVLVPSPVHQLLHCVMHFAWSHVMGEGAWRTFRDVGAIIGKGDFDWDAFVAAAHQARATTAAYWTLRLARSLAELPVPAAVERSLRPPGGAVLRSRIERHFALNAFAQRARCPSAWLSHTLWRAGMRPGWSGHGAARPWMWSDDFRPPPGAVGARADGRGARVRHEVERATRWAFYVRRVATGATGRAS